MTYTRSDINRIRSPWRKRAVLLSRTVTLLTSLAVGILAAWPSSTITTPVLRNWSGELQADQFGRLPLGWLNATSVGFAKSDSNAYELFFSSSYWFNPSGLLLYGENRKGLVSVEAVDDGNYSSTPYRAIAVYAGSLDLNGSSIEYVQLHDSHYWLNLTAPFGATSTHTTRLGLNYSAFSVAPSSSTILFSTLQIAPAGPGAWVKLVGTSLNLSVDGQYPSLKGNSSILITNYTYAVVSLNVGSQAVPVQPGEQVSFRGPAATLAFHGANGTIRSDVPDTYELPNASLWVSEATEINLVLAPVTSSVNYAPSFELVITAGKVRVAASDLPTFPSGVTSVDTADQTKRLYAIISLLTLGAAASQIDLLPQLRRRLRRGRH